MQQLPTRKTIVETLFERWTPVTQTERISLDCALHRVLAQDYEALYSIPVVRSSILDGVAVKSGSFANGMPDTSNWKLKDDFCRADTGDDFDDQFDAVIPIEQVEISPEGVLSISPTVCVKPNMNVRPSGTTIRKGETVGKTGRLLRSFDLAALAMGGITEVDVYKKPRVSFLPTGTELVPLGQEVQRGQTIDSNSILAKNMLLEMGADPFIFPITKDSKAELNAALDQALANSDVVIICGGSSKGEEDFNARILEERGVTLFHWVAAAPGKPMCVALIDNKPVINLPGPPMAMFYGMDWCIRSIVNRLLHRPMPKRQTIRGTLTEEIVSPASMEILCMMDVDLSNPECYTVKQKPWKGGSTMPDSISAGAFYITEIGTPVKHPGEIIEVTLLRGEEEF